MLELNHIYQGNCLEIMPLIADKSIDMILCDLPYGTTACKWDTIIPFESLWLQYKRIIKDNGVIVLTASQPFTTDLINSNRVWFKYEWIWDKGNGANFMNIKNRPFKTQEQILVFAENANFTFNPIRVLRNEKSLKRDPVGTNRIKTSHSEVNHYGLNRAKTVYQFNPDGMKHPVDIIYFQLQEKGVYKLKHPTKKPVALFEYLIRTYTNEGDLVLDNCIGSGTTAIACLQTDRNFIGMELEPKYVEIANKRIEDFTKQLILA